MPSEVNPVPSSFWGARPRPRQRPPRSPLLTM